MCDPVSGTITLASSLPYIAMAGGTLMQYKAQQEAQERAQSVLNSGQDMNDRSDAKARKLVEDNSQQYQPTQRLQNYEQSADNATASLTDYLNKARAAQVGNGVAATGKVSNDYLTGAAKSAVDQTAASVKLAQLMGRVRAPTDLMTNEGFANADAASQAGIIGGKQVGMARAIGNDATTAGQPSPGMMLAGQLMQGAGTGMAMSNGRVLNTGAKPDLTHINLPGRMM